MGLDDLPVQYDNFDFDCTTTFDKIWLIITLPGPYAAWHKTDGSFLAWHHDPALFVPRYVSQTHFPGDWTGYYSTDVTNRVGRVDASTLLGLSPGVPPFPTTIPHLYNPSGSISANLSSVDNDGTYLWILTDTLNGGNTATDPPGVIQLDATTGAEISWFSATSSVRGTFPSSGAFWGMCYANGSIIVQHYAASYPSNAELAGSTGTFTTDQVFGTYDKYDAATGALQAAGFITYSGLFTPAHTGSRSNFEAGIRWDGSQFLVADQLGNRIVHYDSTGAFTGYTNLASHVGTTSNSAVRLMGIVPNPFRSFSF